MIKSTTRVKIATLASLLLGGLTFFQGASAQQQQDLPQHPPVATDGQNQVVQLCDGETNIVVKGVPQGQRLTPDQAREATAALMAMWYAKQDPETAAIWKKEAAAALQSSAQKQARGAKTSGAGEQPNDFTSRDVSQWDRELKREIDYGNQIFHDDKLVGSTNGVACAMCHPNAANTHPETYPKFQIQLRRVALLRDMINWCIENPSRGKVLAADDPKMRAIEAYILSQRKGVPMQYGKH